MDTIATSVWVHATEPGELGHDESRAFVVRCVRERLPVTVPTLLLAEVAGSSSRLRGASRADRAVALLLRLPLPWLPLDAALARVAGQLASAHRLRGADAVDAAVALQASTTLISLDREHHTRRAGVVNVQTPVEALAFLP